MHARLLPHVLALGLLGSLSACAAKVDTTGIPGAQTVSVSVDPGSASLVAGQATQFNAVVTGTADVLVTWQVEEVGGGTVDQNGLYTAPAAAGSYHVRAVSHFQPDVFGVAAVAVTAQPEGTVAISPKSTTVAAGGTVTFTASVENLESSAVTWKVQEASGCGTVTSGGVYKAPSTGATCHVAATSVSDPTKSDVATITVNPPPPAVTISLNATTASVDACKTYAFSATVSNSTDTAVVWTVAEAAGGTVSSSGLYTAPSTAGTYHVVATAHASSSAVQRATVTVKDHVLSIKVNPPTPTVNAGGSQQFTATVTTTCGAVVVSQQ
jgi:hypothetical protein